MRKEYVKVALEKAAYKKLDDIEEWIVLKISDHDPFPVVNGLELKIPEKVVA